MVVLATSKSIVVTCTDQILGINCTKKEHNLIECGGLNANAKTAVKTNSSRTASVECASLSRCGKYLVVCCGKNISMLKTDQWSVVSVRELVRISNSVKFTPSSRQIVVADRSGDAYLYSAENPEQPGELLLGHTSMLVDILVTTDERFVVTCDRDEKIRVSNFPNAYDIHSFCLGHEKFVSCVAELPHDVSVLVSGSGDGTIRFWDFLSGTESFVVNKEFSRSDLIRVEQKGLEDASVGSCAESEDLPIRCFSWFTKEPDSSVGCVCVGSLPCCFIFSASGRKEALSVCLLQNITLLSEPWTASFSESGVLWVLQQVEGKTACAFVLNESNCFEENCGLDDNSKYILSTINEKWELFSLQDAPRVLSVLYKRIFDDVQEYYDRKKARLLSKTKTV